MVQTGTMARSTLPREPHAFLVVRENQLAYQTVMRLKARHPRMTSSVVTLIGPAGSGKSHLARQLHREVLDEHSDTSILRTSAAEFTGKFQRAARESQIREFQKAHREKIDLLIFDDLHELQTRPEVQQQLVAMLDDLLAAGGRVMFTARQSPGEVKGLSRRLVNRCQGGILVDLQVPGDSSRRKLIEHFAGSLSFVLPEPTVAVLAKRGPSAPGELLEIVGRLRQVRTKGPISPDDLASFLATTTSTLTLTLNEIAKRVARHYGLKLTDLRSASRLSSLVTARHVAMYLAREIGQSHFATIGDYFGGRNHASVMYACQRVEKLKDSDPALSSDLDQLTTAMSR